MNGYVIHLIHWKVPMSLYDPKHLQNAYVASGKQPKNTLWHKYWWHLKFSFAEGWQLTWIGLLSFIHGLFPFLFGFGLLERYVKLIKYTKKKVPNNTTMKKVHFNADK